MSKDRIKINLDNGQTVFMKRDYDRKTSKAYKRELYKNSTTKSVEKDGDTQQEADLDMFQVELAVEKLVLGLVDEVVEEQDGEEVSRTINQKWIDELPNSDYERLAEKAQEIQDSNNAKVKKNQKS